MATKAWPKLARKAATYPPLYVSIARAVPTFFVLGAGIELFMQKVPVGGRTFYDVALDKEVSAAAYIPASSVQLQQELPALPPPSPPALPAGRARELTAGASQAERRYLAKEDEKEAAKRAAARQAELAAK